MLVVADDWQRRGVGRRLMAALDAEMSRRDVAALEGLVLAPTAGCSSSCSASGSASSRAKRADVRRA
jgi:GNAT superfamily N-acetyltransferase